MKTGDRNRGEQGFSLVELMISSAVVVVVGLVVAGMLQSALTVYVKNFSINDAHANGRKVTEKLAAKIQRAVDSPVLIDKTGAAVSGSGPAAGIQCLVPNCMLFYRTSADTAVNTSAMKTTVNTSTLLAPKAGDSVMMQWYDTTTSNNGFLFAQISSVSVAGSTATLTFANKIQTYFKPSPASTAVIKSGQPFQIINRVAFIAVPASGTTKLRYYPAAKSVAADGQTAFDNPAHFMALADLVTLPGQTDCLPFTYTTPDQRYLDLNIRSVSKRYDKRSGSAGNFFNSLQSKVGIRSITHMD